MRRWSVASGQRPVELRTTDHGPRTTNPPNELPVHEPSLVVAAAVCGALDGLAGAEVGRASQRVAALDRVRRAPGDCAGADSGDRRDSVETAPAGDERFFRAGPLGQHSARTAGSRAALR